MFLEEHSDLFQVVRYPSPAWESDVTCYGWWQFKCPGRTSISQNKLSAMSQPGFFLKAGLSVRNGMQLVWERTSVSKHRTETEGKPAQGSVNQICYFWKQLALNPLRTSREPRGQLQSCLPAWGTGESRHPLAPAPSLGMGWPVGCPLIIFSHFQTASVWGPHLGVSGPRKTVRDTWHWVCRGVVLQPWPG